MSKKIQLIQDYYDNDIKLYKKKAIEIKPGVTVLVGCNGIGKTTLLHQIKDRLKKDNIPYILFDNLKEGGSNSISHAGYNGDFEFMTGALMSSEGETIVLNLGNLARRLGDFVRTGNDEDQIQFEVLRRSLARIHGDIIEEQKIPKERWILLDAVDSGLSIDNIVDLKEQLFKTILQYNYGNEIYIIVSANEYEMARHEQCFDVYNGKYVALNDYEAYRKLVLQSKEEKYKRTEHTLQKSEREEEYDR